MPLGEPFLPQPSAELILLEMGIQKTSELPHIIPPLPTGDTKDLKVWKEYWMKHDAAIRKDERGKVLDEFMNKIVSSRFELDEELVVRMSDVRVIREELRQDGKDGE